MSVDPDRVPWDRVVHWYGRATGVPAAIRELGQDGHASAERFLLTNLEHQDGVSQATPLAVRLMLRALSEGAVRDTAAVRQILERCEASARFQVESRPGRAAVCDWSLYSDDRLWPEFVSEEEDEALWEEWNPSDEESLCWSRLTLSLLADATGRSA